MKGIKTLAIAMAVGLTAFIGVASASASVFEIPAAGSQSTTKWNGALTGKNHVLALGAETFSCSKVSLSGEMKGQSTSELTVNPELSSCAWIGQSVTWVMNGCKFRFNTGAAGENPATGTIDITGCVSPMKFTNAGSGCSTEIGNQNGLGTATFKRTEVGGLQSVLVTAKLTNITYTRLASCPFYKAGTFSDGTYTGEWTVKPAHFVTESAPATIIATGSGKMFGLGANGNLTCSSYSASGTMSAPNAESITLGSTSLSGCISMGVSVTPSMGGCSLTYTASGGVQVTGALCASNPITIVAVREGATCTVTVGPSVPLSGLAFTSEGTGKGRFVKASGSSTEGLEYTASGAGCLIAGTFNTGSKRSQNLQLTSKTTGGGSEVQGLWIE